jgi:hypothetical protein
MWLKTLCRFLESLTPRIILMAMTRLHELGLSALLLVVLTACSQQNEFQPAKPVAEIKGKPIAETTSAAAVISTQTVAAAAAPANSAPAEINGYARVGFDKLASFHYMMPDEASPTNQPPKDQFPPTVKSLHDKPIALRGFMLPLKIEQGLVTEMLIMKDQSMCCYGTTPKITEWVSVKMSEKGVKPIMDQPVTLLGKLHVGEIRENGYLVGIYEMAGDKLQSDE